MDTVPPPVQNNLTMRLEIACTTLLLITAAFLPATAQENQQNRLVRLTVTDSQGRFVTGLTRTHFEILEHGMPRMATVFLDPDSPISVAMSAKQPFPASRKCGVRAN